MSDGHRLVVRAEGHRDPVTVPAMARSDEADPRWSVTSRGLVKDGAGWLPVSGEIHYSRVPRDRWRERLQLMRAGGVDVVSTYVFWIHHQPTDGAPDFSGNLDVAAFVRLCHELGLDVVVRIGPWCHGEVRNGGFPDWVQGADVAHRTDDPGYLDLVRPWFAALGEHLAAVCGPTGPVVGIQIENELYDQPGHLCTLKEMARDVGLRAPLWTATAWGGAELPADEFFPLYSGYGDGFWVDADAPWDEAFRSHYFMSEEWDDPGVGADVRGVAAGAVQARERDRSFPPATCELGGGMATTYHRRPVPTGADIASLANVKVGSGSAWQGYYMYAGGVNPPKTAVQESHATGYPNDLPTYDYDFHAAVSAAGLPGPGHAALRRQHAFLQAFGPVLGDMPASFPEQLPHGVDDTSTLRWSVRTDGTTGFVFVSWHQPHVPLPDQYDVTLGVELPSGGFDIGPLDVPTGTIARWPFGRTLGGATLAWATASALTVLSDGTLVLVAERGVPVDLCLDEDAVVTGPAVLLAPGVHRVAGAGGVIDVALRGQTARIVVVGAQDAERVWVLPTTGGPLVVLSDDPVWTEGDDVVVRSAGSYAGDPSVLVLRDGWEEIPLVTAGRPRTRHRLATETVRQAGVVPSGYGSSRGRASAPTGENVAALAQRTRIVDVGETSADDDRRIMQVSWAGDVAQLLVDDEVVADRFWDGTAWTVDLDSIPGAEAGRVSLRVLPLHQDAHVWLASSADDRRRSTPGPLAAVDQVTLARSSLWRS